MSMSTKAYVNINSISLTTNQVKFKYKSHIKLIPKTKYQLNI